VSEPVYFKYFETSAIKVNFAKGQGQGWKNVKNAITKCMDDGLMKGVGKDMKLDFGGVHVWCVFDRDVGTIDNVDFNESIVLAQERGIEVAWSNDAFELWILLHFEDIDPTVAENKNRVTYYKRLTEIFKNMPGIETLTKKTQHPKFYYKDSFKSEKDFVPIVMPHLKSEENRKAAIQRAKALEAHYSNDQPNHKKAPCTMVHHLVEALLLAGGKSMDRET